RPSGFGEASFRPGSASSSRFPPKAPSASKPRRFLSARVAMLLSYRGCPRGGVTRSLYLDELIASKNIRIRPGSVAPEASGASRRLFYAVGKLAPVFENSAASVYVETSRVRGHTSVLERNQAITRLPRFGWGRPLSSSSKRSLVGSADQTNFTESLILAQDERWRRA